MKQALEYYYNIDIDNLDEFDNNYHFILNKWDYYFVFFNRSIDELNDIIACINELKRKGINCHNIIFNKDNQALTKIGDIYYVLLSIYNPNEEYDLIDIINMQKKLLLNPNHSKLYRNNWATLWSDKVDYFEYQIKELGLEKKEVLKTFSYYIGLAENAISYVNKTNQSYSQGFNDRITLSHRRIHYPNIKVNYLNPLSFIFDLEVRDIAEYLKSLFFLSKELDSLEELQIYLKTAKLSIYSYQMLYARLLYPSYYFDIYEQIMNKKIDEDNLLKVVNKVNLYEQFLKKAYLEISKYANIEKIDWIINLH